MSKKHIQITFGIALVAVMVLAIVSGRTPKQLQNTEQLPYGVIAESADVVLMADTGFDIEWLISKEDGRRQIFERFRLISKEDFEDFTGAEVNVNSVDVSQDNAEVFLTQPDGTRNELKLDTPYITFSILPPEPAGMYTLDVRLNSGEEYNFEFERKEPKQVEFVNVGDTRTLESKDIVKIPYLFQGDREKIELHAYNLSNLDIRKAASVFFITPGNAAYGGRSIESRELAGTDTYFWLDVENLQEVYVINQGNIEEIQAISEGERSATELDFLENITRATSFEYIFLAKIDGRWNYAIANYPDDF